MPSVNTKEGNVEYRVTGEGPQTVVFFHGAHMHSGIALGEDFFTEQDYKIIVPSRPGYGETPIETGTTPSGFADAIADLLSKLNIDKATVVGISAGGRTAMRLASQYPSMVSRLILQSSISFDKWPDTKTRMAANVAFNPLSEKYTWTAMHALFRRHPRMALKTMLSNMTTQDTEQVINRLDPDQFNALANIFTQLRSGEGFMNDLRHDERGDTNIEVPTLIIHSKYDSSVPLHHPQVIANEIKSSELVLSEAESHMIWFSSHYQEIKKNMASFILKNSN